MLHNKIEATESFKVFKAEVEKQCEKYVVSILVDIHKMEKHKVHLRSSLTKWDCCPIYYARSIYEVL